MILYILFLTSQTATFPTFQVNSAIINSLTLNNTKLTTNLNIALSVTNQAPDIINFDNISVDVFYMDPYLILNRSSLPAFTTDFMRVIEMNLSVNQVVVSGAANGINQSLHQYGMVQFGLDLSALIKFTNNIFHPSWMYLNVVCYPLRFAFSSNANVSNITTGISLESLTCYKSNDI
jgi:hypothetical protein